MKTIEEIETCEKVMLIPKDIAPILGVNPYSINVQVRQDIARGVNSFPFEVIKIGNRVKIPKEGFLRFLRGKN